MASNLTPGVTVSMLPGNGPEDIAQEAAEEKLLDALSVENLGPREYEIVREVGLSTVKLFRKCLAAEVREICSDYEERIKTQAQLINENEVKDRKPKHVGVDRVEEWRRFSEHMEKYIREQTVQKYGMGNSGSGGFDLMTITKSEVCVWNILRYSLRNWNGKGKEHDLEKIVHYAEMAWTMGKGGERTNSGY